MATPIVAAITVAAPTAQPQTRTAAENWVGLLNEWLVRNQQPQLVIKRDFSSGTEGPQNQPTHTMTLRLMDQVFEVEGRPGQQQKELRQEAARLALQALEA